MQPELGSVEENSAGVSYPLKSEAVHANNPSLLLLIRGNERLAMQLSDHRRLGRGGRAAWSWDFPMSLLSLLPLRPVVCKLGKHGVYR